MRPKTLSLFGEKWRVTYLEPYPWLDHRFRGRTNYEKKEITVLIDYQEKSTLLHELIHVASDTCHAELTETQVERLEKGLHLILQANPKLLDYFKGESIDGQLLGGGVSKRTRLEEKERVRRVLLQALGTSGNAGTTPHRSDTRDEQTLSAGFSEVWQASESE